MPVANKYRLAAVKIGTVVIGQITDESYSPAAALMMADNSATGQEIIAGVDLTDVRAAFSTTAVKTALATLGLAAIDLAAAAAVLYFAKYTAGGAVGSATYATVTIAKGIAYVTSIAASLGQPASVSVAIVGASADGTTAPHVVASGVAAPTMTAGELYTLGEPAAITSLSIDSGIAAIVDRADLDVFNTFVAAEPARPRIRYTTADLEDDEISTAVDEFTLANVPQGGTRGIAPITFSLNQSLAHVTTVGGSPFGSEIEVVPTFDGTNAPIVITGVAAA